ncbi:hypothetical protein BVG19_g5726 [[Candida] boidinii]|nr:hypothetical protein BVG19_g5726 [[Candida] boidinii]OWB53410.1 hypothetical protein B5S27_g5006 [[Candida] boidinii]
MQIYSVYILNKSGGLIYQRDYKIAPSPLSKLNTNDYLVLAGTLHSVHAISSKLTPDGVNKSPNDSSNSKGLRKIETSMFSIYVHQTTTGTKFIFIVSPNENPSNSSASANDEKASQFVFQKAYELYCDYVMKNPFYQLEMPIRCKLFEDKLTSLVVKSSI